MCVTLVFGCPQKPERVLDPLELEVQVVLSCLDGCWEPSSGRAKSAVNHLDISVLPIS